MHTKTRRSILKKTKGFKWGRSKLIRLASTAVKKAGANAYVGRKLKKRVNRRLWQVKLNAAVRVFELSYSKFIHLLKTKNVEMDRKVLADMAENHPGAFATLVEKIK